MQLLSLIEAIASQVNSTNVESFVSLVEKLITLGESIKQSVDNNTPQA